MTGRCSFLRPLFPLSILSYQCTYWMKDLKLDQKKLLSKTGMENRAKILSFLGHLREKNVVFIVHDKANSFFTLSVTYVFHRNLVLLTMEVNKT